jgi:LCP family protein required for cell wall assembly
MSYGGEYGGYPPRSGPRQPQRGPGRRQQTQMMPRGDRQRDYGEPPHMPPQQPNRGYPPQEPPDGRRPMGDGRPPRRRRWSFGKILLTLVMVIVLFLAGVWIYLEFSINRTDALHDYSGRPAAASGTNWLIVGSDSRDGLSSADEARLSTGDSAAAGGGQRTDTIMVAHIPDNNTPPTLLSLPRDSEVKIPGKGTNKINAAFSLGGAPLLVETVEQATGLHMDHYAEIGFGGFANIVDAIGGVNMCIDQEMHDTVTNVTIPAGCQDLDGAHALGFVRMRHSEATPRSDLDRAANQRKFIGALVSQVASPGTFLNPFDFFPLLASAPDALTMDTGDHVHNLVGLAWAMRGISSGGVTTTTVPVVGSSAEKWDKTKSNQLFSALQKDTPIPQGAIFN